MAATKRQNTVGSDDDVERNSADVKPFRNRGRCMFAETRLRPIEGVLRRELSRGCRIGIEIHADKGYFRLRLLAAELLDGRVILRTGGTPTRPSVHHHIAASKRRNVDRFSIGVLEVQLRKRFPDSRKSLDAH